MLVTRFRPLPSNLHGPKQRLDRLFEGACEPEVCVQFCLARLIGLVDEIDGWA